MSDHKKIAKNSLYLLVRMLIQMVISLYTSRLILNVLGVDDYGVYSIVGGFVALVGYVNQAMGSSTMRFITFSLGRDPFAQRKKVFNTSIVIHFGLSVLFVLLAETIGLWFFYYKLNLPSDSLHGAFVIYQLSVVSMILVIMTLPYSSLIIAYEKMSIFAYFSIIDTIMKLVIVYVLIVMPFNKLIVYGWLMLLSQIIYSVIYFLYCYKKIPESRINFTLHKNLARRMVSFAGWSMFGCTAAIGYTQGINVLLNLFGGVAVNASRGLAVQVQGIVSNFVANFQTAVNPQIIKSYAQNQLEELHKLIYLSSKFSFYIVFILITPLILNINAVLKLWLGIIPEKLPIFVILILLITLVDTLSNPIMKSADATGRIKRYHIIVGTFLMFILPVAYVVLKQGAPIYSVFIVQLIFCIIALFIRLYVIKGMVGLDIKRYFIEVILPVLFITVPSAAIMVVIHYFIHINSSIVYFIITSTIITVINFILIWLCGINRHEKAIITQKIHTLIHR